jgi:hypothetical protein
LLQERATPTPITILQQVFFREWMSKNDVASLKYSLYC